MIDDDNDGNNNGSSARLLHSHLIVDVTFCFYICSNLVKIWDSMHIYLEFNW